MVFMQVDFQELSSLLAIHGLSLMAVDSGGILSEDRLRLELWQAQGHAADMQFMMRSPEMLSSPATLFPELVNILVLGLRYSAAPVPAAPLGFGRVARYAWGQDYHLLSKKFLEPVLLELQQKLGEHFKFRVFSDAVPLLERALASRAGLGFVGKNTMLIKPGVGSFFFLAEVLTNLEIKNVPKPQEFRGCSTCSSCISACPTNALVSEYNLDARRCISYLTIEKRGFLNSWECAALGDWLYGCDICQEVCPFNQTGLKTIGRGRRGERQCLLGFEPEAGCGSHIELSTLFSLKSNSQFKAKYGHSALMRGGRKNLLRNACCVALNTGAEHLVGDLVELAENDSAETVRWHALRSILYFEQGLHSSVTNRLFDQLRPSIPSTLIAELEQAGII